jgi:hypothetical protein
MDRIAATRARLDGAGDLPSILDAAYEAFEDMLLVIRGQVDPAQGEFAAFVMSAASAANGRDVVAAAPSLPPANAASAPVAIAAGDLPVSVGAQETAVALAGLSHLLASRLSDAAAWAADAADRAACTGAAGHASRIWSLLAGAPGP